MLQVSYFLPGFCASKHDNADSSGRSETFRNFHKFLRVLGYDGDDDTPGLGLRTYRIFLHDRFPRQMSRETKNGVPL